MYVYMYICIYMYTILTILSYPPLLSYPNYPILNYPIPSLFSKLSYLMPITGSTIVIQPRYIFSVSTPIILGVTITSGTLLCTDIIHARGKDKQLIHLGFIHHILGPYDEQLTFATSGTHCVLRISSILGETPTYGEDFDSTWELIVLANPEEYSDDDNI